jgi:hypothetical protein
MKKIPLHAEARFSHDSSINYYNYFRYFRRKFKKILRARLLHKDLKRFATNMESFQPDFLSFGGWEHGFLASCKARDDYHALLIDIERHKKQWSDDQLEDVRKTGEKCRIVSLLEDDVQNELGFARMGDMHLTFSNDYLNKVKGFQEDYNLGLMTRDELYSRVLDVALHYLSSVTGETNPEVFVVSMWIQQILKDRDIVLQRHDPKKGSF